MKARVHLPSLASIASCALLALSVSSASAAYRHTSPYAAFGSDGTSATSMPAVGPLAYQQTAKRLYALSQTSPRKLYAFSFDSPGTLIPLGGTFPLTVKGGSGDPDIAVDNTAGPSANNIYYAPDGPRTEGFDSIGTPLPGFPVDSGSEVCGTAVDNEGHLWVGNFGADAFEKFRYSGGLALATFPDGHAGKPCHLTVDLSNNDVYLSMYNTGLTWRYTAASGYSPASATEFPTGANAKIAVNPLLNRVYAATDRVRVFDTADGSLIEEFGGGNYRGIAVESSTDTVFLANSNTDKVEEWRAANVPLATTGAPTDDTTVSGEVFPDESGSIIDCYFEYGPTTSYGSKESCSPDTPYVSDQAVTADLLGLISGTTYHYRLVAWNADGVNFGGDRTVTPIYVADLQTLSATDVQRTTANLRGSFNGEGLATHYYFEWGPTTEYGSQSAAPPYSDAGMPVEPTTVSFNATGLQADTTYHYRIVAENSRGLSYGGDQTFTTLSPVQSVHTEAVTDIARQTATVNGSYLGDGAATTYYFEYGTTASYGRATPVQGTSSASGPTSLSSTIGGLQTGTTYHYRVVVTNDLGTDRGQDVSFVTNTAVPGLVTKQATGISQDAVTLTGEFVGSGDDTRYYFEWGTSTAYGQRTAIPPGEYAGAPVGAMLLSAVITDFKGFFTYHYRVVASNEFGVTFGNDRSFSTLPSPPPGLTDSTATGVTPSSVVFGASISPNRSSTKYRFEYGSTSAYGRSTAIQAAPGFGNAQEPVSTTATDLRPGTTYHYRAVAISLGGTTVGPDQIFSTPGRPTIDGLGIGTIDQRSAQAAAVVSASSLATVVRFQYGTSRAYGELSGPIAVGTGTGSQPVAYRLAGLTPGMTYHFRVLAENGLGVAKSTDRTFTTLPDKATGRKRPKCRKAKRRKRGECVRKRSKHSRAAGR